MPPAKRALRYMYISDNWWQATGCTPSWMKITPLDYCVYHYIWNDASNLQIATEIGQFVAGGKSANITYFINVMSFHI